MSDGTVPEHVLYDACLDAIGKDYAAESAVVTERIRARRPEARTLLDVACGTGRHLVHLRESFACTGVDLDPGRLRAAAARNPSVALLQGDMRKLPVASASFDAVTCLFSSIGYMDSALELRRALRAMAVALVPGGVLVVEPWLRPEQWTVGYIDTQAVGVDDDALGHVTIVRAAHSGRRSGLSIIDTHYLVAHARGIAHRRDVIRLRLHTWAEYETALYAEGFDDVEIDRGHGLIGRGLIVARRR